MNKRLWEPGRRVKYGGYPGTLLAPPWDWYAWVLLDWDRERSAPPRTLRLEYLEDLGTPAGVTPSPTTYEERS